MKSYALVLFGFLALALVLPGCILPTDDCTTYSPVCGVDNKEYNNACTARQANVGVAYEGKCVQCIDSDKGKNASEFGHVMAVGKRYDDYCANDKQLIEYYCENSQSTEPSRDMLDCPDVSVINDAACVDGKCTAAVCSDSDGGKDLTKQGVATKGSSRSTDSCSGKSVVEYYCENNKINNFTTQCASGYECVDGACAQRCTITAANGTYSIYAKDTATKGTDAKTDVCKDSATVVDYYCLNNQLTNQTTLCPANYYCVNGACVSNACRDSDHSNDPYTSGTVQKGTVSYLDYCSDSYTVHEYYCDSGNNVQTNFYACPSSYICSDGRCVPRNTYCYDSDNGQDRYEKGQVEKDGGVNNDYCTDSNYVREYYCDNNDVRYLDLRCENGYTCSDGYCNRASACSDSDGGRYPYTYGYTMKNNNIQYDTCYSAGSVSERFCDSDLQVTDVMGCASNEMCNGGKCISSSCVDPDGSSVTTKATATFGGNSYTDYCRDGSWLMEYMCFSQNSAPTTQEYDCGTGRQCSDGKCVDTCTDSDGGDYPNTKGTATAGSGNSQTDSCNGLTTLTEYYCTGNARTSKSYTANNANECWDGRLVEVACVDPDAGSDANLFTKTTVTRGHDSQTDRCSENYIIEYYCNENMISYQSIRCQFGCSDGGCILRLPS
ncbi:MAG: Kazal-type serine protease inhibitor [Candidatus Micrarchaeota archaeon]